MPPLRPMGMVDMVGTKTSGGIAAGTSGHFASLAGRVVETTVKCDMSGRGPGEYLHVHAHLHCTCMQRVYDCAIMFLGLERCCLLEHFSPSI